MTLITLVRHGQTDWNLEGRIQGSTDVPLNDTGRRQAREAAERLRDDDYSLAVTSPLSRAVETAEIIAGALGLGAPERIAGLAERVYGDAEGASVDQLSLLFPHTIPGAEPEADVVTRIRATLRDLAMRFPDERIVAASHGGVIGRLLRDLHGGEMPVPGGRVTNGSIWRFEVTPESLAFDGSVLLAD
ncbi:histidine phosphatase family protein [Microbacterium sediminis]|uniref:Uncharacterized protein n=1 Tax=Microbacterium sediminis TaxID=904291 RepID=A0A1B9N948_9MICO|nr:histidine phosphatase family protein [Microbacterium sediminis]OCG73106.1 hypothetical protein A7J15_09155 [Microbacterium sediminis]QBR74455.1 histidine phosphatase family protein [Microbacterium sediminis]